MKYIIHYSGTYEDSVIVIGETMEDILKTADVVTSIRGWEECNCWSEKVED